MACRPWRLHQAASVIVLTPFKSAAALDYADVLLPVAPFSETSGTFVNCEGRVQSFHAAAKPLGETRPAWKVLRVLGNLCAVAGFDHTSSEDVRAEVFGGAVPEFVAGLENGAAELPLSLTPVAGGGLQRLADVPIHFADPLVRRAPSLQKNHDARMPTARMNAATLARLGLTDGDLVKSALARRRLRASRPLPPWPRHCMPSSIPPCRTMWCELPPRIRQQWRSAACAERWWWRKSDERISRPCRPCSARGSCRCGHC